MNQPKLKSIIFVAGLALFLSPITEAATINVACPGPSLQAAVDSATAGDIIQVTGICSQNILIRNEKQRITIDGGGGVNGVGGATVSGPSASSPVFNVRGKGILIQGLIITGGSRGVHVNRGSNAVINNNEIHTTPNDGILVNQLAFAVITNNNIHNNATHGIRVTETSIARIGFNQGTDTAASPNTIQSNGGRGIHISHSNARIVGNTISGNADDGIQVFKLSQADIAGNTINGNGGDGIVVGQNSGVNLGNDTVVDFFDDPNSTTVNNAGFGLRCFIGAYADGVLGTLNGGSGATSFGASCIDSTIP